MRTLVLFVVIFTFNFVQVFGQVKIGDNPQNINSSAVLELESTTMALIITRVTNEQMQAIVPTQGALVYNTDAECVYFYNGVEWVNLCTGVTASINVTTDAIVNEASTIVLTPTANGNNLEVAPESIRSAQILDGSIFGDDINDNSIGPNKLANNSVLKSKLSENAVGPSAIDRDSLPLSFFSNDVPFLTASDLITVSAEAGNAIRSGTDGGAFYNDQPLLEAISGNSLDIAFLIANDLDTSPENELQNLSLTGNILSLSNPVTGDTNIDLESFAGGGGNPNDELITNVELAGTDLTITEGGNDTTISLAGLGGSTATEVAFDPYLTIESTNTQTAFEELKDELDALTATGGGSNNITFEITPDSLQITDGAGTLGVPLSGLGAGATPQSAEEVPFNPYLTLEATDTQAAVEELKDEVDALSVSGGGTNIDFLVANDSLEITDAAGTLKVPLALLNIQTALQEEFTPYLSLEATNTQAAVEELKDEVDALAVAGGGNNISFSVVNDSIQIADAAGTLGIALSELNTGAENNSNFEVANDSLMITDSGGTLSVPLEGLGNNTDFAIVADSLVITDIIGTQAVALADIAPNGNNIDVFVANDSLLISDLGGNLGVPLSAIVGNSGNNTSFQVSNDSIQITDSNDTLGFPLSDLALTATQIAYDPSVSGDLPATINNTQAAIDALAAFEDTNTTYTAGLGLTLTGTEFVVDNASITPEWSNINGIPAAIADGDDDTTYTAGNGLNLIGTEFEVDNITLTPEWSNINGIPAAIADGDDDTTYTAGLGLSLTGTTFNVNTAALSGNGTISSTNLDVTGGANATFSDVTIALAPGSISGGPAGLIADNTVTASDLAPNAVGNSELANGVVTPSKLDVAGTAEGDILIIDGGAPIWRQPAGGALKNNVQTTVFNAIRSISTNSETLTNTDYTVIINRSVNNINLFKCSPKNKGQILVIKDLGGVTTSFNVPYIDAKGKTSRTTLNNGVIWLQSDGINWHQIN